MVYLPDADADFCDSVWALLDDRTSDYEDDAISSSICSGSSTFNGTSFLVTSTISGYFSAAAAATLFFGYHGWLNGLLDRAVVKPLLLVTPLSSWFPEELKNMLAAFIPEPMG